MYGRSQGRENGLELPMLKMMGFRVAAGCDLGGSSLFRDAAFALPFPAFSGAGRSDFASLHQFANVSGNGTVSRWVLERRCKLHGSRQHGI